MTDNLTGIQPPEVNREEPWSPAGNSGLSEAEMSLTNYGDTTQELGIASDAAHESTDKLAGVVTQAKDFLGEKFGSVGSKIKDFTTDDLGGMANKAKDFARQKPGQAILFSAAAGLLLGLFVRARR